MRMIVATLMAGAALAGPAQAADLNFIFATTAPGPSVYIGGSGKLTIDQASGVNGRYRVTGVNGNYVSGILLADNIVRDRAGGPLTRLTFPQDEDLSFITFASDGTVTDFGISLTDDGRSVSLLLVRSSGINYVASTGLGFQRAAVSIEGFVPPLAPPVAPPPAPPPIFQPGAVPEPATWAMMIGGFGLVGGAIRRQKAATLSA